ncbi:ligand-dependent nuclear receptor-interacting factor 1 isoform X2 [Ochotona princeps]|nr:ligand-dependent nuclear receptor-interacting factor 1 isoform X2 [Ochotona princeps]
MASIVEKDTQERNEKKDSQGRSNKASYLKSDAEFRKIFGITKDLRVCLSPVVDYLDSGESSVSFSSSVNSSTLKETDLMVKEEERNQNLDKKRKSKTPKKMDYTKRRKTKNSGNTAINGGANATSSQFLSSVLPTSDVLQHDIVTSHSKTREDKRTETEHCTSEKQEEQVVLSSNVVFEQGHSFSKNYTEDMFPTTPPELEETIREEKIRRLKQVLREKEAALEEMRKKMHQK